ncbi:MAG: MotA/TolQ/ExbB proton channel family protein, partial [Candidatus Latescibacteria bacterium]|nr:MotA/TolQ/ExbB proton channel family protein [Candidatus Latescibacterota bacterium]
TTAVGLFVAIPALWAYNFFINRIDVYSLELENESAKIIGHLARRSLLNRTEVSD